MEEKIMTIVRANGEHIHLAASLEWVSQREVTLASAQVLSVINTNEAFSEAASCRKEISRLLKELETSRKSVTKPLDEAKKEIMTQEKQLRKDLDEADARLQQMMMQYETEQAKRIAEQKAARMEAEADAAVAAEMGIETSVVALPVEKQAYSSDAKIVRRWSFDITDAEAVPRELCSPDASKIRAWLQFQKASGKKIEQIKIAGLALREERSVELK